MKVNSKEWRTSPRIEDADDLAIEHLQLTLRTCKACLEARCDTIGKVRVGLSVGVLDHLGKVSRKDLENALTTLDDSRDSEGRVDWDQFRGDRPLAEYCIAFASRKFDALSTEVRGKGLGALHFKKAQTGWHSVGVETVGDLVDAAGRGIRKSDMDSFGALARTETLRGLVALNQAVGDDGDVDWIVFATHCGFEMIPRESVGSCKAEAILKALPKVCEEAVKARFPGREWTVFQQRFLAPREKRETLESLGEFFGVTRERIRQNQNEALGAIKDPVFADDYSGLEFRLRDEFLEFFRSARAHFSALNEPTWIASEWKEELCRLWGLPPNADLPLDFLLMRLLGYEDFQTVGHVDLEPLIFDENTPDAERGAWVKAVSEIHRTLSESVGGMDFFGLAAAVKKAGGKIVSLDELPKLISLCPTAEVVGGDQVRLRFDALKTIADRAYRVLSENGAPMSRVRLMREINGRVGSKGLVGNVRTLVNQMTKDPRLKSIQKSGEWTLVEWRGETGSLIDVMVDVLRKENEAMTGDAIADAVLARRPGARSSFKLLLTMNPDKFVRVGPALYALAEWEEGQGFQRWDQEAVGEFVEGVFRKEKKDRLHFREVRVPFSEATGLGDRSAQGVLIHHPAMMVERPDSRTRIAIFVPDWRERLDKSRSGKVPQPERIVASAKKKLSQTPWGQVALLEIVKHVENDLGVPRPNIYAAISQTDEIETFRVEGRVTKVCCLSGTSPHSYPQLEKIVDLERKRFCTQGISKLHLEEVDIGLFILGREFDYEMKNLLIAARDFGGPEVKEGHLKVLHHRIEWAVRNGVLEDGDTLLELKEARNDRGHEPPPLEKRREMLVTAPFLAGLYLDNLLKIQEKTRLFKEGKEAESSLKAEE